MLKIAKITTLISLLFYGFAFGAVYSPKVTVKLDSAIGYRIGDIIHVRVLVEGMSDGFVLDNKKMPQKGAKLDKYFEFYGYESTGREINLRLQIFRLADSVSRVVLPLPKLIWKKDSVSINVNLPQTKILFGPISASDTIEILKSMAPPLLDSMRENGPYAMVLLGIIISAVSLFILVFNAIEKIQSPQVHPYFSALRKLRNLKKSPKGVWIEGCFNIFHEALNIRFGKVLFSSDPDIKYLPQSGRDLLALSDRRNFYGEKMDLTEEAIMKATTDTIISMLWEER